MTRRDLDRKQVRRALARHLETFRDLESAAERCLWRRRHDDAAAYAQVAADYAWRNHPGVFVSPRLEAVLAETGRAVLSATTKSARQGGIGPVQRVLHVLTEAHIIGGHTRLVQRWIERDRERSHTILLTRQREGRLPQSLVEVARASGGDVAALPANGRLVERARALRETADAFDAVVLHIHPFDVLPGIAFADHGGPPVVLVNHADHVFWLGAAVADVVACIRGSGLRLAGRRRGIEPGRCAVLPLPIDPNPRPRPAVEAKRALGYPPDTVLLLTVGQDYKYAPVDGVALPDLLAEVVAGHRNAVLLAVGPEERGPWRAANARTGGRVRALGPIAELRPLYEAADVYVDSYPLASLTAVLEAGSFGVPLVSFWPHGDDAEVLRSDAPGLMCALTRTTTADEFSATLARLIASRAIRTRAGWAVREQIRGAHAPAGWSRYLDELYSRLSGPATERPPTFEAPDVAPGILDELVCRLHIHSGTATRRDETLRAHHDSFPWRSGVWGKIALGRALAEATERFISPSTGARTR